MTSSLELNSSRGDTYKSKFTNNGVFNKHNYRYWDDQNPYWVFQIKNESVWGINLECGLINCKLSGPYFYQETLNGRRYKDLLINEPNMLDDLQLNIRDSFILSI